MISHDHPMADDTIPVCELGLDEFECGLLAVLRHFLTAFTKPESHGWQTAFGIAAERWGAARGPQIAHSLLAVIHAMRLARDGDFHFSNPLCTGCRDFATNEEAAFCVMVHAMRRDRADLARGAVMALAEGVMDPGLIEAALGFAARFPTDLGGPYAPEPPKTARAASARPSRRAPQVRMVH